MKSKNPVTQSNEHRRWDPLNILILCSLVSRTPGDGVCYIPDADSNITLMRCFLAFIIINFQPNLIILKK
jgi:hypothetical protein